MDRPLSRQWAGESKFLFMDYSFAFKAWKFNLMARKS